MPLQYQLWTPEPTWCLDPSFPDLTTAESICIDLETSDPGLNAHGPGGIRGEGHVAGIAIAASYLSSTVWSSYYPIAHLDGSNLDRDVVVNWLSKELSRPNQIKLGANLLYDLEWLWTEGIEVAGPLYDVQVAEALINEEGYSLSLNALAKRYLGKTKREEELNIAFKAFDLRGKGDLWKLAPGYVGEYAIADVLLPLQIWEKQKRELRAQDLWPIFELECKVSRVLWEMRKKGVRVDLDKAEKAYDLMAKEEESVHARIRSRTGFDIDVWSADSVVRGADHLGLSYHETKKGNPSFAKEFLETSEVPFFQLVRRARQVNRLRETFVKQKIMEVAVNGRIHCSYSQTRTDEGGTRSGRLSSSNPNLQQVPSRSTDLAPLIRTIFMPEDGEQWAKLDYAQQEPRILIHYAGIMGLTGAGAFVEAYNNEPNTNFYDFLMQKADLSKFVAKTITLGRCYGMGIKKMAKQLDRAEDECEQLLRMFDSAVPFVKELAQSTQHRADTLGLIKTLLGRRRHFDLWAPERERIPQGLPLAEAKAKWPGKPLQRHGTYKALNALIQGSAADMTKQAMVDAYEHFGKIPLIQVHDELNYSVKAGTTASAFSLRDVMENCVKLKIPVKADLDIGECWK